MKTKRWSLFGLIAIVAAVAIACGETGNDAPTIDENDAMVNPPPAGLLTSGQVLFNLAANTVIQGQTAGATGPSVIGITEGDAVENLTTLGGSGDAPLVTFEAVEAPPDDQISVLVVVNAGTDDGWGAGIDLLDARGLAAADPPLPDSANAIRFEVGDRIFVNGHIFNLGGPAWGTAGRVTLRVGGNVNLASHGSTGAFSFDVTLNQLQVNLLGSPTEWGPIMGITLGAEATGLTRMRVDNIIVVRTGEVAELPTFEITVGGESVDAFPAVNELVSISDGNIVVNWDGDEYNFTLNFLEPLDLSDVSTVVMNWTGTLNQGSFRMEFAFTEGFMVLGRWIEEAAPSSFHFVDDRPDWSLEWTQAFEDTSQQLTLIEIAVGGADIHTGPLVISGLSFE